MTYDQLVLFGTAARPVIGAAAIRAARMAVVENGLQASDGRFMRGMKAQALHGYILRGRSKALHLA